MAHRFSASRLVPFTSLFYAERYRSCASVVGSVHTAARSVHSIIVDLASCSSQRFAEVSSRCGELHGRRTSAGFASEQHFNSAIQSTVVEHPRNREQKPVTFATLRTSGLPRDPNPNPQTVRLASMSTDEQCGHRPK